MATLTYLTEHTAVKKKLGTQVNPGLEELIDVGMDRGHALDQTFTQQIG